MEVQASLPPEVGSKLETYAVENQLTKTEAAGMLIAHGLDSVAEVQA